jgi:hypothetical protein
MVTQIVDRVAQANCPVCGQAKRPTSVVWSNGRQFYAEWCSNPECPDNYHCIHLAINEWGNEVMRKIAMEYFENNPVLQFVEIYEHAGWYLGFRRDGSIWSTANDMAVLDHGPRPHGIQIVTIRR